LSSLNVTGAITSGDITSSNIISGTSFRGGLGSISAPTFSFTSDPNTGIFSRTDILGLVTSGTEQMTILSNGRVGIGTTNPSSKLEVVGQLLASGASGFIQSSNQIIAPRGLMGMGSGTLTSSGTAPTGTYPNSVTVDPSGRFVYVTNSGGNDTVSSFTINQTTGTLTSSGTALTGTYPTSVTVDPSGRFVYVANINSQNVSSYTINQTTGTLTSSGTAPTGSGPYSVNVDPSGRFAYVANNNSQNVSSYTINQTTGTLTSSGTAPTGINPNSVTVDPSGRFVYVAHSGSNIVSSYTINNFSAGSAFFAGNVGIGTTNPGYRLDLPNVANATGQGRANAWVTYSDLSLKENISPLIDSLDKVISLRGVSFEWKGSGIASSGFIAQEVEKIIPDLVSTDIAGIKAIDYSRLTPYLVSAIQEQQLQISGISSNLSTLTEELDLKLNEETGEIVTSISSLINSTSATNDLINLNQTANITTITALDSRVEVLENYSLDISDFQASASATLSELNQRIGLFEQIMSLTSTDSATLSASSALESLIDSRILGAFTSQIATFSALTVTSGANINNLAVTGNITNGLLTINGFDDSLATPSATLSTLSGPLKIQHQALGEIDFMGGKAIIDTEGNLKIVSGDLVVESGLIKGNNLNRGSNIEVLQNTDTIEILFSKPRENDDYAVVITSSWITTSAVTQKNVNGFYVKFGILAPMDAKFDWVIID
jgi:DNA-binding beta-propeller fold protein YncE